MKPGFGVERFRTLKKSVGSWWGGYIDFELDMVTVFQILYYFVFWSLKEHQCFLAGPKGQLSKLYCDWLTDWLTDLLTPWLRQINANILLPDQLELWNFEDWVNVVYEPCPWILYFWDHVRAMLGPCRDHVWPSPTSRPARALKFSRLSKHGLRPMSTKCLLIRTISGPCLDHVGAMFGLALLPDQLEH